MPQLSPEQWKDVSQYLDQALSVPETKRPAWLDAFRQKNPELADLLQTLLNDQRELVQNRFLENGPIHEATQAGQELGA